MSNSKLLKLGFYCSVSCTPVKCLFKKNWSELFMNHQIDLSCSAPSTIVLGDSVAAGPARFSDVWHNFFRNALNLGIGGDRTEHIIWRVDNLSFPASIKYVIIHCGTNNIKFNNPTDIANGILCIYYLIQSKLPNAQIIVTGLFPRSQKFSYFRQIVNDVNIELGNACSLYQILFFKPNDDWLQANGKLNPQLFWDDDLHLSKTGYQKFATSLSNFISSCNASKSTSFYLRKIDNSFPPLSRTNIHIPTKEIVHLFKKHKFCKPKYIHKSFVHCLHVREVSVPVPVTAICVISPPLLISANISKPVLVTASTVSVISDVTMQSVNVTRVPVCRCVSKNERKTFFYQHSTMLRRTVNVCKLRVHCHDACNINPPTCISVNCVEIPLNIIRCNVHKAAVSY